MEGNVNYYQLKLKDGDVIQVTPDQHQKIAYMLDSGRKQEFIEINGEHIATNSILSIKETGEAYTPHLKFENNQPTEISEKDGAVLARLVKTYVRANVYNSQYANRPGYRVINKDGDNYCVVFTKVFDGLPLSDNLHELTPEEAGSVK